MTAIEYFGINTQIINNTLEFLTDKGLNVTATEVESRTYGNPMPYIKIVNLDDDFINFPNPLAILVLECRNSDDFGDITSDAKLNLTVQLDHIFGENKYFLIPVYGKELDIKAIAKSDFTIHNITAYKRLGVNATSFNDPPNTIKIDTYKSPSRLMLL